MDMVAIQDMVGVTQVTDGDIQVMDGVIIHHTTVAVGAGGAAADIILLITPVTHLIQFILVIILTGKEDRLIQILAVVAEAEQILVQWHLLIQDQVVDHLLGQKKQLLAEEQLELPVGTQNRLQIIQEFFLKKEDRQGRAITELLLQQEVRKLRQTEEYKTQQTEVLKEIV